MGNPTILSRRKLKFMWKCKNCRNVEFFEEDWVVEIVQNTKDKSDEIKLAESINIRCEKCGSRNIEEVKVD